MGFYIDVDLRVKDRFYFSIDEKTAAISQELPGLCWFCFGTKIYAE